MENPTIFKDKTFEGLLQDIYENTMAKKQSIRDLKDTLSNLINNAQDAAAIVPLVKELLDVEVKSDEHLVKMAAIIQRLISAKEKGGSTSDWQLTEKEKQELMSELDDALTGKDDVEKIREKAKNVLEAKDATTNP